MWLHGHRVQNRQPGRRHRWWELGLGAMPGTPAGAWGDRASGGTTGSAATTLDAAQAFGLGDHDHDEIAAETEPVAESRKSHMLFFH